MSFLVRFASSMTAWRRKVCSCTPRTIGRNPFCSGESHWWVVAVSTSRAARIPENILYIVGSREIGLKFSYCDWSPFLYIGTVRETFHDAGIPSAHTRPKMTSRSLPLGSRDRRCRYSMPSFPGAVLTALFSFLSISSAVGGVARYRISCSSGSLH